MREETQTRVKHREDTKALNAGEEDKTLQKMLKRFTTRTQLIYYRLIYLIPLRVKLSLPSASGVDVRSIATSTTYQNVALISLTDLYQSLQVAVMFPDKNLQENCFFPVSQLVQNKKVTARQTLRQTDTPGNFNERRFITSHKSRGRPLWGQYI